MDSEQIGSMWKEYVGVADQTICDALTPLLSVFVPELLPNADGCLPHEVIHTGGTKCPFSATCGSYNIKSTRCIKAVFIGRPNGLIPCVHEGERVRVYNYAGTEQFYWDEMGRDPGLRRHERMRWFAMAQPSAVVSPKYVDVKDTNSYFIEVNTNPGEKEVHFHTCMLEAEKHIYDWYLWPEKGTMHFHDDIKNELYLQSCTHYWKWRNTDNSYVEIDRENITIHCNDTFTVNAGKHIKLNAGLTYTLNAPTQTENGDNRTSNMSASDTFNSQTSTVNTQTSSYNASGTHTLTSPQVTINASGSYTLTAGTATYTANHMFSGDGFVVGTGTGSIPGLVIIYGSNSW